VIRELRASYDVRPCGPNWPARDLEQVDSDGVRFYLELDPASGSFARPHGLERLSCPKFAWLIDTHKKPAFHAEIARDMDLTFYAHKVWGHVFKGASAWLPLHADEKFFHPVERARDLDVVFVGSQEWRAEPLRRIAERHGLKIEVRCTTGPREKSETAALYARAKLVFNRHCANDLNFRVFESMACGRVLLTDAQWNGQYDLFEDKEHYLLYKDERDLESLIIEYLARDEGRKRIEQGAFETARKHHTTAARVRQLVAGIEEVLAEHDAPTQIEVADAGPPLPMQPKRGRWLFFVGDEPATVERKTYAERVAGGLARSGHEVVVSRTRRRAYPCLVPEESGEPAVVELDLGPIPRARTGPNHLLASAAALHMGFARVADERGLFDVIVGEGALGGLVAQPVAARLGKPFVLALRECEVAKLGNRLTREQLNIAELEHWWADRAEAVVVPSREMHEAVSSFYKTKHIIVLSPAARVKRPEDAQRLAQRLGLGDYVVILSPHEGEKEKSALLRGSSTKNLVIVTDDARLKSASGDVRLLSRLAPRGTALAALLAGSKAVVALERGDPRAAEACELGVAVATVEPGEAVARGAGFFVSAGLEATHVQSCHAEHNLLELEALLDKSQRQEATLALLH
jgi:glycosyltransferase involved in cell wall biosynthesis